MPEVTDLMRVAQYVKSDRDAPADVHNAACRMLDKPDEAERLRAERDEAHSVAEKWFNIAIGGGNRADLAEDVIERVRQYAAELRSYNSPAGIAAVYADALDALLPPRGAESHQDAQTGADGTRETTEAPRDAQEAAQ